MLPHNPIKIFIDQTEENGKTYLSGLKEFFDIVYPLENETKRTADRYEELAQNYLSTNRNYIRNF